MNYKYILTVENISGVASSVSYFCIAILLRHELLYSKNEKKKMFISL